MHECITAGAAQAIVSWSGHSLMQEYLFLGDMRPQKIFGDAVYSFLWV